MTLAADKSNLGILYYILWLPASLRKFIFHDKAFLKEFLLPSGSSLRIGNGPPIDEIELFCAVRQAFEGNKSVEVISIDNHHIQVVPLDKSIEIHYTAPSGSKVSERANLLRFLHPEESVRLEALDSALETFGPTHPEKSIWRDRLKKGHIPDDELSRYLKSLDYILPNVLHGIENEIAKRVVEKAPDHTPDFLVPDSLEYFENLFGSTPGKTPKDEYFSGSLLPRMRKAIQVNLIDGLELILPMGIRDDLMARQFLEDVSNEELKNAIETLLPIIYDPISKINLIDLCLSCDKSNQFFEGLASQLLNEMFQEESQSIGDVKINDLFEALIRFTSARIRINPGLRQQPVYWQRLCAWTHAGLLLRVLSQWRIEKPFLKWLDPNRVPYHPIAAFLELIEAPSGMDHISMPINILAYLIRRVIDIFSRHEIVEIKGFDLEKFRRNYTTEEALNKGLSFYMSLRNPLDLDVRPANNHQSITEGKENLYTKISDNLENEAFNPTTWVHLFLVANLEQLPQSVIEILVGSLKIINVDYIDQDQREHLRKSLQFMAACSQKLASPEMSEEVMRIIIDIIRLNQDDKFIEEFITLMMLCCMAYDDIAKGIKRFSETIYTIAYFTKRSEYLVLILNIINDLKALLPIEVWFWGSIEAYCVASLPNI